MKLLITIALLVTSTVYASTFERGRQKLFYFKAGVRKVITVELRCIKANKMKCESYRAYAGEEQLQIPLAPSFPAKKLPVVLSNLSKVNAKLGRGQEAIMGATLQSFKNLGPNTNYILPLMLLPFSISIDLALAPFIGAFVGGTALYDKVKLKLLTSRMKRLLEGKAMKATKLSRHLGPIVMERLRLLSQINREGGRKNWLITRSSDFHHLVDELNAQ